MSSKYGNEVKDFDHVALRPPSMDVDVPVILSAPGEQRYIINDAIYKIYTQNCQQVPFYNIHLFINN